MSKSIRGRLGVYGRESYFVPILMLIFGVFLMTFQSEVVDWESLLTGFVIGAGIMGLLYRHVYRLSAVRKAEPDSRLNACHD